MLAQKYPQGWKAVSYYINFDLLKGITPTELIKT